MAVIDKKDAEKLPEQKPFTVRATQLGYYGQLREEGDTFEISGEEAFSDQWMQKVD